MVSIIGSFRKEDHYSVIKKAIKYFKKHGLIVLSPKGTRVKNSIDDFVIFESDDCLLSPEEIQMVTLDKIIHSNAVYVCNVGGYVGRTTCYEIGFCLSRSVPLYFYAPPNDLPIPVDQDHIKTIEEFCKLVLDGQPVTIRSDGMGQEMIRAMNSIWPGQSDNKYLIEQKRLMICGSMRFYSEMKFCQEKLLKQGVEAIIPKDEGDLPDNLNEHSFLQFKRKVSNSYLKKIRDSSTAAILVFNEEKNGLKNYIGANTFVEIAMAFAWNRQIFLLNDIYEPFQDELLAWECKCLKGNLDILVAYWQKNKSLNEFHADHIQLSLFE